MLQQHTSLRQATGTPALPSMARTRANEESRAKQVWRFDMPKLGLFSYLTESIF